MSFKYRMNKILITLLFLLNQFNIISSDYISIPFKIYQEDLTTLNFESQIMSEYISNKIYFPIQIGKPSQNVYGTVNSLEFELLMKRGYFFCGGSSNLFDSRNSFTFTVTAEKISSYFDAFDSKYAKDNFNFCINYNIEQKKCEENKEYAIDFIYSQKTELNITERDYTSLNYVEIGLNLKTHYGTRYSLYKNLYENNFISSNSWFLYYFEKNPNDIDQDQDDGVIVFGEEPNNFFKKKDLFNSSNIFYTPGINRNYDYANYWSIIFNEVKMKSKDGKIESVLDNNVQGVINHNYRVIVGSEKYEEFIDNKFFMYYFSNNICSKKLLNNKFSYYVCNSNLITMEDLKKKFPIIYMKQIDLNYVFELTSDDLFIQRADKIYFLVVFNINNPTKSFLLGSAFLKKYFFYFDNNKEQIAFYQENIKNQKEVVVVHWYNSAGTIIFLIILFIVIGVAGFYFGRKIYIRRKLRANELDDQFDYYGNKNEEKNENNLEVEMKLGV